MAAGKAADLVGAWRLVSLEARTEDTGETLDLLGPTPQGFLILGAEGRMMTVITAGGRVPPRDDAQLAAAFRAMTAYTGRYNVEDDRLVIQVDVSWHPSRENTELVRFFHLDGDRLTLTTGVQTHPSHPGRHVRATIVWTREATAGPGLLTEV